jgi:hypothetical protein
MTTTPQNFRFRAEEKDDRLMELFQEVVPYKVQCPECKGLFYRQIFENSLEELLKKFSWSSEHLLDHMESYRDLKFWECPACEEPVTLQKPRENYREKIQSVGEQSK